MKKRIVYFLVFLMMTGAMSGCAGMTKEKEENEEVTLTWYVPGRKQEDIKSVMEEANEYLTEKIGARLDLRFIDADSYTERITMMMASKEDYDLAFVGYNNSYLKAATNKRLYPIKKWIDESTELKNSMPGYAWEDITYMGEIYAVPNNQIFAQSANVFFKKDLVDKYGFDLSGIRKGSDLEPFLQIIKENEPDIYPVCEMGMTFVSYDDGKRTDPLLTGVKAVSEDGGVKVVRNTDISQTYNHLKKKNEWYKKGYIRKDIGVVSDESVDIVAGKYAVMFDPTYKPGGEEMHNSMYGYEVVSVPLEKPYVSLDRAKLAMIGIGADSKNPQKAFEFIKLINTDKYLYNLICFGIENKHYKKTGGEFIEPIGNSGYNPGNAWEFGNQFNAYLLPGQNKDDWKKTEEMNQTDNISPIMGFIPNVSALEKEINQVETVVDEYSTCLKGTKNPDEYYAEYLEKLERAGVGTIVDELQKQIDEFLAKGKE